MRKAKKWMTLFLALLLLIQPASVQAEDESIEDVLNKPSEYTYVDLVLQTWKKGDFPLAFNTAQGSAVKSLQISLHVYINLSDDNFDKDV